jgi:hypothetical protein
MSVHDRYADRYFDELDMMRQRLGREPSKQERDRLSDRVWQQVTGGREHSCPDCEELQIELGLSNRSSNVGTNNSL